jgi:hypothetical protein
MVAVIVVPRGEFEFDWLVCAVVLLDNVRIYLFVCRCRLMACFVWGGAGWLTADNKAIMASLIMYIGE